MRACSFWKRSVGSPHRPLGGRLARRLAVLTEGARRTVLQRESLRENAAASASIRAALAAAGIDPARVSCLRRIAEEAPRLLAIGDTPELRRADAGFTAAHPRPQSEGLAAKAARQAPRFAGRPPPESGASLLDWYAWSLALQSGRPPIRPHPDPPPLAGEGMVGPQAPCLRPSPASGGGQGGGYQREVA